MELVAIATVESPLKDRASAPKQGDEGAPDAWLVFHAEVADALDGIAVGDDVLLLTWFDRAHRDVLRVHPRSDTVQTPAGRVQHPLTGPAEPDRPAPRDRARDRRPRGCRSAASRRSTGRR